MGVSSTGADAAIVIVKGMYTFGSQVAGMSVYEFWPSVGSSSKARHTCDGR